MGNNYISVGNTTISVANTANSSNVVDGSINISSTCVNVNSNVSGTNVDHFSTSVLGSIEQLISALTSGVQVTKNTTSNTWSYTVTPINGSSPFTHTIEVRNPIVNPSSALPFDIYISPTGSDTNSGNLSSPWAITSLQTTNANFASLAGKRIGLLPGTYYLTTGITGSIANGSNQMTVSGNTAVITKGMHLVSGFGSAYTNGTNGWGPQITNISGNTLTLSSSAAAALTNANIIATFMSQDKTTGAIQIPGTANAASPTYLGSSDTNGLYSPRTATLDGYGASGVYGGFKATSVPTECGPMLSHTGHSWLTGSLVNYTVGNLVIDGLKFTGFSYKGLRIGGYSSADGPIITGAFTFKNCELFGGGFNTGDFQDNLAAIWIDNFEAGANACLITNNWFHDSVGFSANDMDHFSAIFVFASGSPEVEGYGYEVSYNTVVNAGNIYGKDGTISGWNIHQNYLDTSMYTSFDGGYSDWVGADSGCKTGLTRASSFKNNILLTRGSTAGSSGGNFFPTNQQTGTGTPYGWQTNVEVAFNTIICVAAASGGPLAVYAGTAKDGVGFGHFKYYSNMYINHGSSGSWNNFGNFQTTPLSPQVWDYNIYSSGTQWGIVPDANNGSMGTSVTIYSSLSTFANAISSGGGISGVDAHSNTGTPTFVGTGLYANQYKLSNGSLGQGTGSSDGTTGGTACDMGAWGGATPPTQIGCTFAT